MAKRYWQLGSRAWFLALLVKIVLALGIVALIPWVVRWWK